MRSYFLTAVLAATLAVCARADGPPPALINADFKRGELGQVPVGWTMRPLSRTQGYTVQLTDQQPRAGRRCVVIRQPGWTHWGSAGLLTQTVAAEPYRGRRVRFRAAARTELPGGGRNSAALWARVLRPNHKPGHFADMADRPIRSTSWHDYAVVIDVADDADRLEVGFQLNATGRAWFDEAALEVIGKAGAGNEAPRALAGRGQENLTAFTRLLGYVRHFHPSDEAAAADWERFAIEAVGAVEPAQSPAELTERLTSLFAPLAPTVQVWPTGQPPPAPGPAAAAGDAGVRVIAWRHVGVGCNATPAHYTSQRVTDRNLDAAPELPLSPEPLPKPGEPFTADLGGGVSCRVPLALFADARGTLPRATAPPRPSVKPADFPPTGDDRATRLADVALTWSLLQHFYPYFDVVGGDWPGALREALTAAATDADAAAFHQTLRRLVAHLRDSHGYVRGGSGTTANDGALPLAWDLVEDKLVVTWLDPEAGRLRIKIGDVVRTIDGQPAADRVRAAERLVSGATPQFRRYRALQDLRNGPAGQTVALELQPPRGPAYAVMLTRRPADDAPLRGPSMREPRLARFTEIEPGIVYIDLDRTSDDDMRKLLPKLQKAKGIVFDVRGYPDAMEFLTWLTDRPLQSDRWVDVITCFPDRRQVTYKESDWSLPPRKPRLTAKVAFLTDGRAVSAAETVLSLVVTNRVAPLVGGPTAGSNGSVNVYALPGGYRVSWTGMIALKRDRSLHHGVGVLPTVPVSRTLQGLADCRDEVLERALQLVRP